MLDGRLVVRCYNVGFGDSFLISSYKNQHRFNILIDLGSKEQCTCGTPLSKVATDISNTVSPSGLDILILSHTHKDHIRGLCPTDVSENTLRTSPREIWVPRNCDPDYGPSIKHRYLVEADGYCDRLKSLAICISLLSDVTYHRETDDCISKIEELHQDSAIRYVDSKSEIYRVPDFDGEFTIDVLNPPPKPAILAKTLLDLLPLETLEKCGISRKCISMIKGVRIKDNHEREYIYSEKYYNPELKTTKKQIENLEQSLEEVYSRYPDRNSISSAVDIDSIEIDSKTAEAVKKITEFVCGQFETQLKREHVKQFKSLLNQFDEIDYINRDVVDRAIRRVDDEANDFSAVVQIRWQGNVLLFTGDLCNWNGIKHRVHSVDFLKVPHHGGEASYLHDNEILSTMFPTNARTSIIPTCFPSDDCGAIRSRPNARHTLGKLHNYSRVLITHQQNVMYFDFTLDPV